MSRWRAHVRPALRIAVGAALGAAAGFSLGRAVGCEAAGCPVVASPWTGAGCGLVAGAVATWAAHRSPLAAGPSRRSPHEETS